MLSTAREALPDADVVLFMVDATSSPGPRDDQGVQLLQGAEAPILLVLNKVDLIPSQEVEQRKKEYAAPGIFADTFAISATKGRGVPELLRRVEEMLPTGPMYYPAEMVTDHADSFLVAELIREQALLLTQQEIPYSLAVVVEEIEPRPNDMLYIQAVLYVERDSQKRILIGEGGTMLRGIGQAARTEAEPLLGKRIYLDLWVKVREHWRRDESVLARFGYPIPKKPKRKRKPAK